MARGFKPLVLVEGQGKTTPEPPKHQTKPPICGKLTIVSDEESVGPLGVWWKNPVAPKFGQCTSLVNG